MTYSIDALNDKQKEAVLYLEGPQLILAGAGSGKTRVITHKIACLIEKRICNPYEILALTFTNKAANEMKVRLYEMLGIPLDHLWIGTFHSIANRILKTEIGVLGYSERFIIYDETDKTAALKTIIKSGDFPKESVSAKRAAELISSAKSAMIYPDDFEEKINVRSGALYQKIYKKYVDLLIRNDALDFDDLLLKMVELLKNHPKVLKKYSDLFKYVLVDEYQDTNHPQYLIVKMLCSERRKLCVVGDDDQSIYSWRGADIRNILDFESDFPDAKICKLEQNYRSTQTILSAASAVVNQNKGRMAKRLWTEELTGEPLRLYRGADEHEEARYIVEQIKKEIEFNNRSFSDIAIFYRTNAQSRILEEYCRKYYEPVPYHIVGGFRFYDRKEVKDLLSYLAVIANPADSLSVARVVNEPKRGVGEATIHKLMEISEMENISLFEVLKKSETIKGLSKRALNGIKDFCQVVMDLNESRHSMKISAIVSLLDETIGYSKRFEMENSIESLSRLENINELINSIYEYEENSGEPLIEDFLNSVRLQSSVDLMSDDQEAVTMMTVHCAKGLEFPVVFICGMEDGLFPLSFAFDQPDQMEEERRLFYVALTRSQKKVYLTYANSRRWRNSHMASSASRFLKEIPDDLIDFNDYY